MNEIYDEIKFKNLDELIISGNQFSKIPKITYLIRLSYLDMSNQKLLRSIEDFAFERVDTSFTDFAIGLRINLDSNNIEDFGSKTFCSRYTNESIVVTKIVLTYESMKNMNPCLLTQIQNVYYQPKPIQFVINDPKLDDSSSADYLLYPDVCNCKMIQFAHKLNIEILGVCSKFDINTCSISGNTQGDIERCLSRPEFLCGKAQMSSTSQSVFTNTENTNTIENKSGLVKAQLNYIFILYFIFSLFLI